MADTTLLPFGFDCYIFKPDEIRPFNQLVNNNDTNALDSNYYLRFTRNFEPYNQFQKELLIYAGRMKQGELNGDKQLFCGSKIQLGITVVKNFLKLGLQFKKRIPGRTEFINGTWTGIVSGLTDPIEANHSYDIAFGNFLAYDEEVPYLKFGPFYAVEHNLVLLTGSARSVLRSSFATNVHNKVWICILISILLLSLLASYELSGTKKSKHKNNNKCKIINMAYLMNFQAMIFVYYTLALNKPSMEYVTLVFRQKCNYVRLMSFLWSTACIIIATIYSGSLLAVILINADQNIDSIDQLLKIEAPMPQPVMRHDDFAYKLMKKSTDANIIKLHNMTKLIPRPEVYTREFIHALSKRYYVLLGDDELIETIYDTYKHYYDLHIAKTTYLQFPISIMYRKEINSDLEYKLRNGIVQIFETGVYQRWSRAQKEAYIRFYTNNTANGNLQESFDQQHRHHNSKSLKVTRKSKDSSMFTYRAMSMSHFESFFNLLLYGLLLSLMILLMEIIYGRISTCAKI